MKFIKFNIKIKSLAGLAFLTTSLGCGPSPVNLPPKAIPATVATGGTSSSSTSSSSSPSGDNQNVAAPTTPSFSSGSATSTSTSTSSATTTSSSGATSTPAVTDTATQTAASPAGRPSCTVTQPTLISAGNGQYYLQASATVSGPVQVSEVDFSLSTMVGGYSVPVGISRTAPYTVTYLDSLGAAGYTSTLYVTVRDQNGNYYPNLCGAAYSIRWN